MVRDKEGGWCLRRKAKATAMRCVLKTVYTLPVLLLVGIALAGPVALAQPDAGPGVPPGMASRLASERMGPVQPGVYNAGDGGSFTIQSYGANRYLLRFDGHTENFVLTVERASLGAKILKYDTGTTALRVSVWGGVTLYTQDAPQGVPATFQSPTPQASELEISTGELQTAINDESSHITYVQNIALKFSADPAVLASDPETRGRAFDAMTNAAVGIERFLAANPSARQILVKRVNSVKVAEGGKPTVALSGQTLLVSFVPGEGHEGHASSLAIQQELGKLLIGPVRDIATK
jgi:hypothetical protein